MIASDQSPKMREIVCPIPSCRSKDVSAGRSVQKAVIAPLVAPGQPAPIYAFREFTCRRCGHSFEMNVYEN
jgi:hypothetical protein